MTKACTNNKCPAYAHYVYTVETRCVFCRWDLQGAGRIGDAEVESVNRAKPSEAISGEARQ